MEFGTCSECGTKFEVVGMRTKTCGPECSMKRQSRHAYRVVSKPTSCSECGQQIVNRLCGKRLTCGPECATSRTARIKAEKYAARPKPQRICADCPRDITGRRAHSIRCDDCQATYRKINGRALARERIRALAPEERRQRKVRTNLKSKYGMTVEQFDMMAESQGHLCAVCGLSPVGRGKGDVLVVDHCHKRGHVRGLLCGNCNIAIGLMRDDPSILLRASEYTRHWNSVESAASA